MPGWSNRFFTDRREAEAFLESWNHEVKGVIIDGLNKGVGS